MNPGNNEPGALSDAQLEGMSLEQLRAAVGSLLALRRRGLLDAEPLSSAQIRAMSREQIEAVLLGTHDELVAYEQRRGASP